MARQRTFLAVCILLCLQAQAINAQSVSWKAGVAKRDITPKGPVRLSGYASRSTPSVGVADPLAVRSLALMGESVDAEKEVTNQRFILVSVDSIGLPESVTQKVLAKIRETTPIQRSEIVFCASHSHATPHLSGGLSNLFAEDLSAEEQKAMEEYTVFFIDQLSQAVIESLSNTKPVELYTAETDVMFGVNRRVLANRQWAGAGNPPDGVRDTKVPVLGVKAADGWIALAYNYACHCTSISPAVNKISGDWAGISAQNIEKINPGVIALPIIGCGADINPNPRGTPELAAQHGAVLATHVNKALQTSMKPLKLFSETASSAEDTKSPAIAAHFGFAGLAPERPSREALQTALTDANPHRRRWAKNMLDLWDRMGRIPETYPAPIHTWKLGSALTWVFLSGEVVCDYQIRLKRELTGDNIWVSAYTDDCFGYVASERMRAEGGYEVDDSMIYYNQPGRWQSGTEDLIVRRVKEIFSQPLAEERALEPAEALKTMQVPAPFVVDLIAAEPLIEDPVHLAFDARGGLWVVEMRDYPEGNGGRGGAVKYLEDSDQDSVFDKATVFMDGLSWPNGVYPWRDGVVISCAPEVFFARDTDGDGKADEKRVLVSGFPEANPQHRVNGFSYSLDNELQFSSGDSVDAINIAADGSSKKVAGRDLALNVDTGKVRLVTGTSQYGRSRDDYENWFGNSNSFPMYHFVIEEDYLARSKRPIEQTSQQMFDPPVTPPIFPASRTVDRFNDLWTANRFTSACAAIIVRDDNFDVEGRRSLLVCEPVHNLVHRSLLTPLGATFAARRATGEEKLEWFRSTDPWSRPVYVENAPDGSLFVADMYRQFIEHPEWIPLSWQERIDVRAGEGKGRIYRVRLKSSTPKPLPNLTTLTTPQLIEHLSSTSGTTRDLVMQQLIWREDPQAIALLKEVATNSESPTTRIYAWATLKALNHWTAENISIALQEPQPDAKRLIVRWAEPVAASNAEIREKIFAIVDADLQNSLPPRLALQYVLTLGQWEDSRAALSLTRILSQHGNDPWIIAAAATMRPEHDSALAETMLKLFKDQNSSNTQRQQALVWLSRWIQNRSAGNGRDIVTDLLATADFIAANDPALIELAAAWLKTLSKEPVDNLPPNLKKAVDIAATQANSESFDNSVRIAWISWLGIIDEYSTRDWNILLTILGSEASSDIRRAALERVLELPDRGTAERLISIWTKIGNDLQPNVLTALVSKKAWANNLLEAVAQTRIPITDLDPATISSLRGHQSENIRKAAEQLFGTASTIDRDKLVATMLSTLKNDGEAGRGELLYKKHCAICHQGTNDLPSIGPSLSALTDRSTTAMLTAILHPNKAIEAKYKQRVLITEDGETLRGVVIQENASSVTLGQSDGSRRTVAAAEIEDSRDLSLSLMPEGFERTLQPEEFGDLIKFLQTVDFSTYK